jgi:hypothetical protein
MERINKAKSMCCGSGELLALVQWSEVPPPFASLFEV